MRSGKSARTDRATQRNGSWPKRHRKALGIGGAVIAAGAAVLWILVVPEKAETTSGVQSAAIRWGHSLTWALLSLLGLLVAADAPKALRSVLAWLSLAAYAAFVLGMVL